MHTTSTARLSKIDPRTSTTSLAHARQPRPPSRSPAVSTTPQPLKLHVQRDELPSHVQLLTDAYVVEGNSNHAAIQASWGLFSSLGDEDRNLLLRGILSGCAASQVEFICTTLSLKFADAELPPVHLSDFHNKLIRDQKMRGTIVGGAVNRRKSAGLNDVKPPTSPLDSLRKSVKPKTRIPEIRSVNTSEEVPSAFSSATHYASLLNSGSDPSVLLRHISSLPPRASLQCARFLARRAHNLLSATNFARAAVEMEDAPSCAHLAIKAAQNAAEAQHATLWTLDQTSGTAIVLASTFLQSGHTTPCDLLFHHASLLLPKPTSAISANVASDPAYLDLLTALYDALPVECAVRSVATVPVFLPGAPHVALGALEVINKAGAQHTRALDPTEGPNYVDESHCFATDDVAALEVISAASATYMARDAAREELARAAAKARNAVVAAAELVQVIGADGSGGSEGRDDDLRDDTAPAVEDVDVDFERLELGKVLRRAALAVAQVTGAESGVVLVLEREEDELWTVSPGDAKGRPRKLVGASSREPGRAQYGNVMGVIVLSNKLSNISREPVPLVGRSTGTTKPHRPDLIAGPDFSEEDKQVTESFACIVSAAISLSRSYIKLGQSALDRANETQYIAAVLNSMPGKRIVATFDAFGRLRNVNRPNVLGLTSDTAGHRSIIVLRLMARIRLCGLAESVVLDYEVGVLDFGTIQSPLSDGSNETDNAVGPELVLIMEEVDRTRRTADALARVLPASEVSKVLEAPDDVAKGLTNKSSVMITDIKEFSRLSEIVDGADIVNLLNSHFATMLTHVSNHGGLVDTILGDGTLSVFGAPFSPLPDSRNAVVAALRIRDAVLATNKIQCENGLSDVRVCIGISIAPILAAVMGNESRNDFTVLGATVSFAITLEKAGRDYGCDIVVDRATRDEIVEGFHIRELDTVSVNGRDITLFEPIAEIETHLSEDFMAAVVAYELGLGEYSEWHHQLTSIGRRAMNWLAAIQQFKKAAQLTNEEPARFMMAKCAEQQKELDSRVMA
ncbi:hypothetical protein M427DRAFT_44704 [Gonapodya prolifera JEL478]|uniref:Guanylate cyclase domain-containing protein n=1 Tax=Gonapodya prolifera (strain JEL478) TaxID=1344416 RepID=A0A139ADP3_GONPJ|nr:hypothetical protein M427DRAFT_44704 [Gonapodya prolifera JEL478]|eukprot:KXS14946.1 hypothetical protein M427DRAFT_44704 [Gonapodya prolifera JEL478]